VALANVVVDQDLTINDLLRLATTLRDFDPSQLRAHSYRVDGHGGVQGGESVIIPDLNAPTTKAVLEFFRGQAQLTDVAPPDATAATDSGATTTAPAATTTTPTTAAAPTTTQRPGVTTTGPAAGATTTAPAAGATTTVPVIDVAPNPLGIAPPDDPSCR
jgi:hypothetical protein